MTVEIKVPAMGESVTEATVSKWFKKEGEAVKRDEPLLELETDKVTVEVPSPADGAIESITAGVGATVTVGALLGAIAEGKAGTATAASPKAEAPKNEAPKPSGLPANGQELHRRLQEYDAKLAAQKLCQRGQLLAHVTQAGVKAGYSANMSDWSGPALPFAVDAVKEFELTVRQAKPEPRTAA